MNINSANTDDLEIPPFQGDYAKTIFLSLFQKPFKLNEDNNYARYLTYECGISDVNKYHTELFWQEYIIQAPLFECYSIYTVNELKPLLEEIGQSTKGKKEELIGIAYNRLIRMDASTGDAMKTWRFSNMKQWNVNWEIKMVSFGCAV